MLGISADVPPIARPAVVAFAGSVPAQRAATGIVNAVLRPDGVWVMVCGIDDDRGTGACDAVVDDARYVVRWRTTLGLCRWGTRGMTGQAPAHPGVCVRVRVTAA